MSAAEMIMVDHSDTEQSNNICDMSPSKSTSYIYEDAIPRTRQWYGRLPWTLTYIVLVVMLLPIDLVIQLGHQFQGFVEGIHIETRQPFVWV